MRESCIYSFVGFWGTLFAGHTFRFLDLKDFLPVYRMPLDLIAVHNHLTFAVHKHSNFMKSHLTLHPEWHMLDFRSLYFVLSQLWSQELEFIRCWGVCSGDWPCPNLYLCEPMFKVSSLCSWCKCIAFTPFSSQGAYIAADLCTGFIS